jgi:hypothetical protein
MAADAFTPPCSSHVGCVNALVLCGKYVCSAGGDAMVRGEWLQRGEGGEVWSSRCAPRHVLPARGAVCRLRSLRRSWDHPSCQAPASAAQD